MQSQDLTRMLPFTPTHASLQKIADLKASGTRSFHHHNHILYDIATQCYPSEKTVTYLEIGTYDGMSASLMILRPNTKVIGIDIGNPVPAERAIANVERVNKHNNNFTYVQGSSLSEKTIARVREALNDQEIDILFIDGAHDKQSVISDFTLYFPMVSKGGFVVFDDYNDKLHSPGVKIAVDELHATGQFSNCTVYGTPPNSCNAHPVELYPGCVGISNEFILRKNAPDVVVRQLP
jgi:predicted O-methyltransferase YrrM